MSLQSEKKRIIERINLVQDIAVIEMIKTLLDSGLQDQEGRISIEQYNIELEAADEDINQGNGVMHEDLKKQMKEW